MVERRHKLRLRKQVVIAFPIALILFICMFCFILHTHKLNENIVKTPDELEAGLNIKDRNSLDYAFVYQVESAIKNRQRDNTVIYYAQKFKLHVDKTIELVHSFTENYTNEVWKENYIIGPEKVVNAFVDPFSSEEAGIIYFVRDLYRYPEKYGSSLEEIRASNEKEEDKIITEGTVYLQNGLTYEQYLGRICDLFGVDKSTALAISYLETGYLKSGLFQYDNNVGGQRGYAGWMEYPTLEAGIIGHVTALRAMLNNYEIDLSSENAIADLSSIYVNGHPNNPSPHWTEKVTIIKRNIEQKDLFTIE